MKDVLLEIAHYNLNALIVSLHINTFLYSLLIKLSELSYIDRYSLLGF